MPCNVKSIESDAFYKAAHLLEINLPEGLERIESNAFCCCRKLRYLTLPSTLTYIGENAFFDCCLRSDLHLPSNLKYIGSNAFAGDNIFRDEVALPRTLVEIHSNIFGSGNYYNLKGDQVFDLMRIPGCSLKVLSLARQYNYFDGDEEYLQTQKVTILVNALISNNTLQELNLTGNRFNNSQLEMILKVLYKCPMLKKLILMRNSFTSMDFLLADTKNQTRIQSIILNENRYFLDIESHPSKQIDFKPFLQMATTNPELYDFGYFPTMPNQLIHMLDVNKHGRVLIVGTDEKRTISLSVWSQVLWKANCFDPAGVSIFMRDRRAASIIYYLLRSNPMLLLQHCHEPAKSILSKP